MYKYLQILTNLSIDSNKECYQLNLVIMLYDHNCN